MCPAALCFLKLSNKAVQVPEKHSLKMMHVREGVHDIFPYVDPFVVKSLLSLFLLGTKL